MKCRAKIINLGSVEWPHDVLKLKRTIAQPPAPNLYVRKFSHILCAPNMAPDLFNIFGERAMSCRVVAFKSGGIHDNAAME